MQTTEASVYSIRNILVTLFLGASIGLLSVGFIALLNRIELLHEAWNTGIPAHLLLIPGVLFVLEWSRRQFLFFPLKISQLPYEKSASIWTIFMTPLHLGGTLLSHLVGVSVGREGAAVLSAAGLVRALRLNWVFWGPVSTAIGFSSVVGQFWVSLFFMTELFGRTSLAQKIYAFVGAVTGVLVLRSFGVPHLFAGQVPGEMQTGFFTTVFFIFLFGAATGFLMRLYKEFYFVLRDILQRRFLWRVLAAVGLMCLLAVPMLRKFQSLGLLELARAETFNWSDAGFKLLFTLLSTALGFFGGEFIPLVYAGSHWGGAFFATFGLAPATGAMLGAYLLFAAATRFRGTGYILILGLMGLSWWFWAYFLVSVALAFAGPKSLYKETSQDV